MTFNDDGEQIVFLSHGYIFLYKNVIDQDNCLQKKFFLLDFFQFSVTTQIFGCKNGLNGGIILKYVIWLNEVIALKE